MAWCRTPAGFGTRTPAGRHRARAGLTDYPYLCVVVVRIRMLGVDAQRASGASGASERWSYSTPGSPDGASRRLASRRINASASLGWEIAQPDRFPAALAAKAAAVVWLPCASS